MHRAGRTARAFTSHDRARRDERWLPNTRLRRLRGYVQPASAAHRHPSRAARPEDGFVIPARRLEQELSERDLGAFIISNPCNPTGALLQGDELERWIAIARRFGLSLLRDEFYSHFIYTADGAPEDGPVSAAPYIEDVNP